MRGFVRGMVKGLKFVYANPAEAAEIAKKEFPTMPLDDLQGDARPHLRRRDVEQGRHGQPRRPGTPARPWCMDAGILKTDVKYDEIIDMSFVERPSKAEQSEHAKLPQPTEGETAHVANRSGTSFSPSATRRCSATSGYGARAGFGKRPALLVIDVN